MKKTLIALAVLATSGAAMAQSTVTLYGVADAYVGASRLGTTPTTGVGAGIYAPGARQIVQDSGGLNGSRWGLRGSEDLGNGLKANFQLESGFGIDTGSSAQGGRLFGRQAWVGASGAFGNVRLGRQYSAYDELRGETNNSYDSSFATTAGVWGAGGDYANRIDNQVYYSTPSMGGLSAAVGVGLGENKTAAVSAGRTVSLNVKYAAGPWMIGYAHQNERATGAATSEKFNLVAGSFDFGVVKLVAGVNFNSGADDDREVQIGLSAPFGATTLYAGLAASRVETSAGVDVSEGQGVSLLAIHDLSKRTAVYAGLSAYDVETPAGAPISDGRVFGVGVRHRF